MDKFIPLSVPSMKGSELLYVTKAIESEWVSTAGAYITEFENNIAEYVHASGAVACQSGTAGLHLALLSCKVGRNDEVIVPTLTFIAAVNPVKYVGAEPIFMDCDDSLTMDPDKLEEFCETECLFTDGKLINKKTKKQIKALLVVHIFGNLADMERLCGIAKRYNLKLIEDATEALGSYYTSGTYAGRFAGTIGDIGVYSFNGNKIITTGGGGMVVSGQSDLLESCRYLSTQAKADELYFIHDEIGYNYRMTNIQAAIGIAQLEQLEDFIAKKEDNYKEYCRNDIPLHPFRQDIRPNYWFYSYLTNHRDELIKYMIGKSIQVRPIWQLIHSLKPYRQAQSYRIEKADYYHKHIINIPCSSNLTHQDIWHVIEALKKFHMD